MKSNNEKHRQVILLVLIICGTLILYSSQIFHGKENSNNNTEMLKRDDILKSIKKDKRAGIFFSTFVEDPESENGINALYNLIIYLDRTGSDRLIRPAMKIFEEYIKEDNIKNKLYTRLGRYFVNTNRQSNVKVIEGRTASFSRTF